MVKTRGISAFYNRYHQKNTHYTKIIGQNNFTYYYWLKILRRYITSFTDLNVLDVGCGVGALSLYCATNGAKVTGLDISQRAIAICTAAAKANQFRHPPQFFCQPVTKQTPNQPFDLVICSEVLEHVPDEQQFLTHLFANLKPSGLLILSTPNADNWLRRTKRLKKFDDSVGHVRLFTPSSLYTLLSQFPGKIIATTLTEGPLRMLLFSSKWGGLIRVIKGPLVPVFHAIDYCFAQLFGWHDQFIVVKKL